MRYGIFDHVDRGAGSLSEFYEDRLKLVEKYDQAGFYAYHTAEHHATTLGMASSPSVFMSAVAQRTKNLKFGPLVYCLPQYHPVRLYEEICMLDQMSNGRFQLGVGKGISSIESGYYGLDGDDVTEIYQEYYQVLIEAMTSDELTFEGKHFSVKNMPLEMTPMQKPHPPIWHGLGNPQATAWPAEHGVNIISNHNASLMRQITDAYRAEWDKLGRDQADIPLMGMTRFMVIAETDDKAMAIGRRIYDVWYKSFMKLWWRHGQTPPLVVYTETFDEIVELGLAVAGSPETVKAVIDDHIAESGINYFLCRFAFGDITFEEAAYGVDAFTEMYLSN
ncbi:MAG: LLM class flavin-dependent oxidoreductase [Rhodospirillaceae bacterium]|nr:LLM class flavin-dependent oxidoreductase [Rhodospirillaceae bacterium]